MSARGRWTPDAIAHLGTMPDAAVAAMIGMGEDAVRRTRIDLGVLPFRRHRRGEQVRANVLAFVKGRPWCSTCDVANGLGMSRDYARCVLMDLRNAGALRMRAATAGANGGVVGIWCAA